MPKKIEFGLDSYSIRFQNWTANEIIEYTHSLGFKKLSINSSTLEKLSSNYISKVRSELNDMGIQIYTSGLPLVPHTLILKLNQNGEIKKHINRLIKNIEISQMIGSKFLRTFILESDTLNISQNDINRSDVLEIASSILSEIEDIAHNLDVTIVIENHQDYFSKELFQFINKREKGFIGVCFDFGNQIAIGEDPILALDTLITKVKMCHIKDVAIRKTNNGYFWRSVPLGKGCIPIKDLYRNIKLNLQNIELFLEISTSRIPTFVDFQSLNFYNNETNHQFLDYISAQDVWLPEIDNYYSRGIDNLDYIKNQEKRHLEESATWFNSFLEQLNEC